MMHALRAKKRLSQMHPFSALASHSKAGKNLNLRSSLDMPQFSPATTSFRPLPPLPAISSSIHVPSFDFNDSFAFSPVYASRTFARSHTSFSSIDEDAPAPRTVLNHPNSPYVPWTNSAHRDVLGRRPSSRFDLSSCHLHPPDRPVAPEPFARGDGGRVSSPLQRFTLRLKRIGRKAKFYVINALPLRNLGDTPDDPDLEYVENAVDSVTPLSLPSFIRSSTSTDSGDTTSLLLWLSEHRPDATTEQVASSPTCWNASKQRTNHNLTIPNQGLSVVH